jgi:hypothetical protein
MTAVWWREIELRRMTLRVLHIECCICFALTFKQYNLTLGKLRGHNRLRRSTETYLLRAIQPIYLKDHPSSDCPLSSLIPFIALTEDIADQAERSKVRLSLAPDLSRRAS